MKKIIAIIFILFLFTPKLGYSDDLPKMLKSYELLRRVPVLDNGRIKPLDTFARNLLVQFSGRDTYERRPAIEWLAQLLFAPEVIKNGKLFLINNPDIAVALGFEVSHNRRYSFAQLQKSVKKLSELSQAARGIDQKQRSIVEEEIIRVYDNAEAFAGISQVFIYVSPPDDFKLSDFAHLPLTLIPLSNEPQIWVSPIDAIIEDVNNEQTKLMLSSLQNMTVSFWQGDQLQFDIAARLYTDAIYRRVGVKEQKHLNTFSLELAYHAWMPFLWARIFYIIAFICFIVSLMSPARWLYLAAWGLIILGFAPHFWALIARIIIMNRPPVSSLYETFIFVACICVALGIWIERINKQWMGIVVAAISGSVFLFIGSRYSAEGDTLKMLVAVLNSNFWLATHVTTITMGYAATCVAGVLGHIWLIQACFKKDRLILDNTFGVMMIILGIALTLTFLGTNLGGIWADQSWGRFWGWDPKENGALMIVLWSAMLFHFRIAKLIGPIGMAAGTAFGVVVVMWAWFGVNLLSIGLHSYGFTSGIASTLLIYVIGEVIFLMITTFIAKKNA